MSDADMGAKEQELTGQGGNEVGRVKEKTVRDGYAEFLGGLEDELRKNGEARMSFSPESLAANLQGDGVAEEMGINVEPGSVRTNVIADRDKREVLMAVEAVDASGVVVSVMAAFVSVPGPLPGDRSWLWEDVNRRFALASGLKDYGERKKLEAKVYGEIVEKGGVLRALVEDPLERRGVEMGGAGWWLSPGGDRVELEMHRKGVGRAEEREREMSRAKRDLVEELREGLEKDGYFKKQVTDSEFAEDVAAMANEVLAGRGGQGQIDIGAEREPRGLVLSPSGEVVYAGFSGKVGGSVVVENAGVSGRIEVENGLTFKAGGRFAKIKEAGARMTVGAVMENLPWHLQEQLNEQLGRLGSEVEVGGVGLTVNETGVTYEFKSREAEAKREKSAEEVEVRPAGPGGVERVKGKVGEAARRVYDEVEIRDDGGGGRIARAHRRLRDWDEAATERLRGAGRNVVRAVRERADRVKRRWEAAGPGTGGELPAVGEGMPWRQAQLDEPEKRLIDEKLVVAGEGDLARELVKVVAVEALNGRIKAGGSLAHVARMWGEAKADIDLDAVRDGDVVAVDGLRGAMEGLYKAMGKKYRAEVTAPEVATVENVRTAAVEVMVEDFLKFDEKYVELKLESYDRMREQEVEERRKLAEVVDAEGPGRLKLVEVRRGAAKISKEVRQSQEQLRGVMRDFGLEGETDLELELSRQRLEFRGDVPRTRGEISGMLTEGEQRQALGEMGRRLEQEYGNAARVRLEGLDGRKKTQLATDYLEARESLAVYRRNVLWAVGSGGEEEVCAEYGYLKHAVLMMAGVNRKAEAAVDARGRRARAREALDQRIAVLSEHAGDLVLEGWDKLAAARERTINEDVERVLEASRAQREAVEVKRHRERLAARAEAAAERAGVRGWMVGELEAEEQGGVAARAGRRLVEVVGQVEETWLMRGVEQRLDRVTALRQRSEVREEIPETREGAAAETVPISAVRTEDEGELPEWLVDAGLAGEEPGGETLVDEEGGADMGWQGRMVLVQADLARLTPVIAAGARGGEVQSLVEEMRELVAGFDRQEVAGLSGGLKDSVRKFVNQAQALSGLAGRLVEMEASGEKTRLVEIYSKAVADQQDLLKQIVQAVEGRE